ncbi:restriction endonuclease subunit S [Pseudomonas helleri]|uniref:restriction endonuclease subunit S n=1 Tax=Pseudomonas helleri TaxID=1608996 RepID=UPI003FD0F6A1
MSSEVFEHSLDSLCLLVVDCPHATPEWTTEGFIVLRNQNIKGGRLDLTAASYTDEAHYLGRIRRAAPQEGDLVITREAPMGEVCQIPVGLKCCLGQRQVLLRPDPNKVDSRFLLYALQSSYLQRQIGWNEGTGSTVSNLRIPVLEALKVPTPPLAIQKEIASTLGSIDDRIALLREINATLEAIAQALFKSWFVDFDPVRAKAEGLEPEGMDAATAALFPDSFEELELGLVPSGWKVGKVEDLMELPYGKALKATDRVDGPVPVYGSGGVTGCHNESLVNGPSVIVGRKGTVGSLYWEDRPFFPIDTVFYVRTDNPLTYCYYLLQTLGLEDMNTDGAVPGLNRNNAYRLPVVVATTSILESFDEIVSSLRNKMFSNSQHTQSLTQLRDTLLPRLISGQLRLPEAEAMVEEICA